MISSIFRLCDIENALRNCIKISIVKSTQRNIESSVRLGLPFNHSDIFLSKINIFKIKETESGTLLGK